MYKHIGKKLKILAEIWSLLGVLGSIAAGVLLYVVKKPPMELQYCIAIAVGGIVLAILSSWGIYAIGDIHTKLERLEDKLIPKPNYMSYLEENQPLRGQCEICGKTTDLINAKIVDSLGTRYRKVCRDCFTANGCEEK
ncbi:MAG: hypothetical protein K6F61_01040 [Clostridiales bacterium]|nr:hypothetical protein [Clostridiales bacterium]